MDSIYKSIVKLAFHPRGLKKAHTIHVNHDKTYMYIAKFYSLNRRRHASISPTARSVVLHI